jgi:conjugal transfer pilus assembly protein TraE
MRAEFAYEEAQKYLRQRNQLALVAGVLAVTTLLGVGAAATRDRELVLVPDHQRAPGAVERRTRRALPRARHPRHRADAAQPQPPRPRLLDGGDPQARRSGSARALKAELVKIVDEQRGSDISQAFVIRKMEVDPAGLTSTVTGTLKTFVGAQVIASNDRSFRFRWTKRGLALALAGFEQLQDPTRRTDPWP